MALEDKISVCDNCGWQFMTKPNEIPSRDKCERCGGQFIHTNITAEEMFLIERTSKDREFINAMIELKKTDIIEYQTRISQFRSQAKADGCYNKPKPKVCCPRCGSLRLTESLDSKCPTCLSTNVRKIGTGESTVSILGLGIFSNKINKTWKCNNCGYTW